VPLSTKERRASLIMAELPVQMAATIFVVALSASLELARLQGCA
jgi:hypothetical protein